jgi:polyferredoxin
MVYMRMMFDEKTLNITKNEPRMCEHCDKKAFITKEAARKSCRSLSKSVRVYQCEHNKTFFHVTKMYKN